MDDLSTQLLAYVKGIWKYRWVAIIAAWVVAIAGWFIVYDMPNDYQASARIYVDTGNVLKPLMQGMTVAPDMQQQVSVMSRTLISRPNIKRLVSMVESDTKSPGATKNKLVVSDLMKSITLSTTGTDNLFTISYNNSDRDLAKSVVQSLLTIFVEGRDDNGEGPAALRFIDEQIEGYEKKLIVQENELKAFKQKNLGMMPQQGGDYYDQVAKAAENLNKTKLDLREAENARDSIRQQITGDEPVLLEVYGDIDPSSIVNVEIDGRIDALRRKLDVISLNYTDQHPDIISTKRLITQLQERKIEEAKLMKSMNSGGFDPGKDYSPMLQQLNIALIESQAKVASMRARVEEYTRRYNNLKSLSNSIPEVEASLAQLNRDYLVNKTNYDELLKRRESAKISGKLGSASKLMTFKIIDPPTVPETPVGPDRGKLYSIVFFLALAAGTGIAFTLNQLRPSFHSQGSLREVTGMPVLGTVPMIWTSKEKSNRKQRLYALGLSLLSLLGSYGILMVKMT
jgi:polysaccharide chain length determinant protein (PEP-CTERM system associated)